MLNSNFHDELTRVEQLKNSGKYEEALQIVNDLENKGEYSKEDLLSLLLLRSSLLLEIRHLHDAYDLAEKVLEQSELLKNYDKSIDALNIIAWVHRRLGRLEESIKIIFREYTKSKSAPNVYNYVKTMLDGFRNPNMGRILSLTASFNTKWLKDMEESV